MNDYQQKRLNRFYEEWQQARGRVEMAEQSLVGAKNDMVGKEGRFKGSVEFLAGPNATWTYDHAKGVEVTEAGPERAIPEESGNGAVVLNGSMSPKQMRAVAGAQQRHGKKGAKR